MSRSLNGLRRLENMIRMARWALFETRWAYIRRWCRNALVSLKQGVTSPKYRAIIAGTHSSCSSRLLSWWFTTKNINSRKIVALVPYKLTVIWLPRGEIEVEARKVRSHNAQRRRKNNRINCIKCSYVESRKYRNVMWMKISKIGTRRLLVRSCGQLLVRTETRLQVDWLVWCVFAISASNLKST